MELFYIVILLVFIIIVLLAVWFVKVQNRLVSLDEMCSNSLSQIGVQQTSRWDLVSSLIDLVSQYNEYEGVTLKEIVGQRTGIKGVNELNKNEELLQTLSKEISVVVEAYPDLKANTLYLESMNSMKKQEENVRQSRMIYNDTVTKLNREIKMIPTSFIAGVLGFRVKDYLEVNDSKTEIPTIRR